MNNLKKILILDNIKKNLNDISWIETSHKNIYKKVFFGSDVFCSSVNQVAYTELDKGAEIISHLHKTLEEVFFIIDGLCEFNVDGEKLFVEKNSIIRIPSNKYHSLRAIEYCKIFYFSSSTEYLLNEF